MFSPSVVVRELVAAGVTGDALVTALERMENSSKPCRSAGAERQARYRERQANKAEAVTSDVTSATCDVAPPPLVPPLSPAPLSPPIIPPTLSKPRGRGKPFPDDFQLSPQNLLTAQQAGYSPDEIQTEIQRMRNWAHNADGRKGEKSDWQRFAFNWFTDSRKKGNGNGTRNTSKPNSLDDIFGKLGAVNDEIERREQAQGDGSGREDFAMLP